MYSAVRLGYWERPASTQIPQSSGPLAIADLPKLPLRNMVIDRFQNSRQGKFAALPGSISRIILNGNLLVKREKNEC